MDTRLVVSVHPPSFYAARGMRLPDAPRRVDAERPGGHSNVERGNETGE